MKSTINKTILVVLSFSFLANIAFAANTKTLSSTMMTDTATTGAVGLSMVFSILFSIVCYCIPLLFGLAFFAFWVWMLVDLLKRDEKDFGPGTNNKVMWLLVMLLTNWIGSAVYYFMIYKKFTKKQ